MLKKLISTPQSQSRQSFVPQEPSLNPVILSQLNSDARIGWDSLAGATSYDTQFAFDENYTNPFQSNTTNLFVDLTSVTEPDSTGYFRVRADFGDGTFGSWNEIQITIDELIQMNPVNLTVTNVTTDSVSFSWDVDSNADGGTLKYFKTSDPQNVITALNDAHLQTTFTVSSLDVNEEFRFDLELTTTDVDYVANVSGMVTQSTLATPQLNPVSNITIENNTTSGAPPDPETEWLIQWDIPINADTVSVKIDGITVYTGSDTMIVVDSLTNGQEYTLKFDASGAGFADAPTVEIVRTKVSEITNSVAIEDFGGVGDGQMFFGTLNVTPLNATSSQITYTGVDEPFANDIVGKQFVSNRIHKFPSVHPDIAGNENYTPNQISCRYSTVTSRIDGKNIIVDKEYNGGNAPSPQPSLAVDGYIFTDNSQAFKDAINSIGSADQIVFGDDKIYVVKSLPNLVPVKDTIITRDNTGSLKPIVIFSIEDAFDYSSNANGLSSTYGSNFRSRSVFEMDNLEFNVDFTNIDLCPPIYTQPMVQGYAVNWNFFNSGSNTGGSFVRHTRITNSNIYAVRDLMIAALGSVRSGANFNMPQFGYCLDGGSDDGNDITGIAEWGLYDTSWSAFQVHSLKGKSRAGILFKAVSQSRHELIENMDVKLTELTNILTEFSIVDGHTQCSVADSDFSFYQMANQDWQGGTSTNYNTFNFVSVNGNALANIPFQNNADWRELAGSNVNNAFVDSNTANIFDKIIEVGDVVPTWQSGYSGTGRRGVFRKVNNTTWDIWGYLPTVGDTFTDAQSAVSATITNVEAKTQDKSQTTQFVHYHRISIDTPITTNFVDAEFTFTSSNLEYLLDGNRRECRHYIQRGTYNHLFYTDGGCNMHLNNIDTHGYWRSSSSGTGVAPFLYLAATEAYFRNVNTFGGGGINVEWTPAYLWSREQQQGSQYRCIIDGGKVLVFQGAYDAYTVEYRGMPSFADEDCRLYNPLVNGADFSNNDTDSALALYMQSHTLDIPNLKSQRINLYIDGENTLTLNGYTQNPNSPIQGRGYGVTSQSAINNPKITFIGDGGAASFRLRTNTLSSTNRVNINLTNWSPSKEYFNNKFLNLNFNASSDANYCTFISATNSLNQNIDDNDNSCPV